MPTCGSLFSGGGGWELGAVELGYLPSWGIEADPAVASVYQANVGNVYPMPLQRVDARKLSPIDVLFASPPCQGYSVARSTRPLADRDDELLGRYIVPYVKILRPKAVLIENVPAYQNSAVFQEIYTKLAFEGYTTSLQTLNAVNYGLPSSRERMYAVFTRPEAKFKWPRPRTRLTSWDSVLLGMNLPPGEPLAAWQRPGFRIRPPEKWPVYVVGGNPSVKVRLPTGQIVPIPYVEPGNPAPAVVASANSMSGTRILYQDGKVSRVTPQAAAKLLGFPDSYHLPPQSGLAYNIVGNAVSPMMSKALLSGLRLSK